MKRIYYLVLFISLTMNLSTLTLAQSDETDTQNLNITVNEICVLDIGPDGPIIFTVSAPYTAGNIPYGSANTEKMFFYTSVVAQGTFHKITAQLDLASPPGTYISLLVPIGGGSVMGQSPGLQILSNTVVTNVLELIGSCATGTDSQPRLRFFLNVTDPGAGG